MAKRHIHIHYHDANPDGTISPDEDRREAELGRKVISAVAEFKREAYDIGGSFRGPGIWSRIKRLLTKDATNHLGEKEYYTFRRWKEAVKAAYPNARFDGDQDICNAVPGGEWDGEKGVVYAKKTGDELTQPVKNALADVNRTLTEAARMLDRAGSVYGINDPAFSKLVALVDEARRHCFSIR